MHIHNLSPRQIKSFTLSYHKRTFMCIFCAGHKRHKISDFCHGPKQCSGAFLISETLGLPQLSSSLLRSRIRRAFLTPFLPFTGVQTIIRCPIRSPISFRQTPMSSLKTGTSQKILYLVIHERRAFRQDSV